MLKVLIVDDELLARLALKTAINWAEYGFEVVAEAEDGLTGYEYVLQYRPDIVLTDISMPGMNGVELVQKTKECCPDTEIIILSCHNDFEYVKEGLRSGAANYLLKLSMSMEELLGELLLLKEKILKKNAAAPCVGPLSKKEKWPDLLFSLMAEEELSDFQLIEDGKRLGLIGEGNYVMLALVSVDGNEEAFVPYHREDIIENLAEAVMVRYRIGTYIPMERNRGIVLCQMNEECEYPEKLSSLKAMLEELIGRIHDCHGIYASAGISTFHPIQQLKSCYRQAYNSLMQRFYTGPGQLHQEVLAPMDCKSDIPEKCFKEILKIIATHKINMIRTETKQWLDSVATYRYPDAGMVRKNIHELLFQMETSLLNANDGKMNTNPVEDAYHQIQKQTYLEDMRSTLLDFFSTTEAYGDTGLCRKREIVLAKKYVGLNYQENLKLSDVALYVNMNVDYFSHLFKKETGNAFRTYLNEFRIEKAKHLLLTGQYKVYETAYAVGFQDENYFIKCFKKQTGHTPLEFMRM